MSILASLPDRRGRCPLVIELRGRAFRCASRRSNLARELLRGADFAINYALFSWTEGADLGNRFEKRSPRACASDPAGSITGADFASSASVSSTSSALSVDFAFARRSTTL